jgi:hypothetical protein
VENDNGTEQEAWALNGLQEPLENESGDKTPSGNNMTNELLTGKDSEGNVSGVIDVLS